MRQRRTQAHTIPRDLGDGLILRRATLDDAEALATFNAQIFRTAGSEQPNRGIAASTQGSLQRGPSLLRRGRFYHRRGGQHRGNRLVPGPDFADLDV